MAEVDADRIGDVIDKLLSNALKFNHSGGSVSISVSSQRESVVVRVTDTGSGVAEVDKPHIFERFYRSSDARRGVVAGAGLGLSTAKLIVDSHHGEISVESAIGHGTTIEVRLPLVA
jgi:signal transduction histidine kinase